ncbi:hypothetical protein Bca52824_072871 [Brassica carinata]|uniref:Uncharacterized protein n=1 Tax=Brassica carinata TaxID=52824 RepID=A0A8X7Q987_BRACI|nr:hypothetical protein Bca52824_072871 [Brassica carinata]
MASSGEKVIEESFSGFDGHLFEVIACRRWSFTDRTESPQGGEPPMITFRKLDSTTRLFLSRVLKSLGESSMIGEFLTLGESSTTDLCPSSFLDLATSILRRKSECFGRLSLILRSSDFELSFSRRSMTRGLRRDRALESSIFLALDFSMIERRSPCESYARSDVWDFRLSLFLKSFDPSDPMLSFVRLLEYSRESWTCLSSSSSEEELGCARMTCTRRRLRGCSSSTCALPSSSSCSSGLSSSVCFGRFPDLS